MYTIIGGDGKEYGPVPAEQIRAWIAAGRASLGTRAREMGAEEWKALGEFPAFGGGAPAPGSAAPALQGDPKAIAADFIERAGKLDIGSCYERSWALLKADFWPIVGVTFVATVAPSLLARIPLLGIVAALAIAGALKGGLYAYFLKRARGQPAEFGDAFSGFGAAYGSLLLASLVVAVLTAAGLVLLILPGVYLAVGYAFTYLLIVDRKLGFWEAMEVSRRVITSQWWRLFGMVLLAIAFAILGLVCLVVGIFVAMPLIVGAFTYAYEDLCAPPKR
jgi:uncharacterized membrane protein